MKRALILVLAALMMLLAIPTFAVSAADGTAKSDYVVYLNGTTGVDTNDGKTEATAVATLAKAIEIANTYTAATEVVVVVTGDTSLGDVAAMILPENNARICVTGSYNGKDYGSKLMSAPVFVPVLYLNGDYTFEYLSFESKQEHFIICAQYNSLKIGLGVNTIPYEAKKDSFSAWPIILVGCNFDLDKGAGYPTFTDDVLVEVYSGEWQYFRGGDRDSKTVFDGKMDIIIDGIKTKISASDADFYTGNNNNGATGKGQYGPNAKITMTISNCELNNLVASSWAQAGGNVSAADITLNIKEGVSTKYFCAVQKNNATFNGKVTVNVYGGDFSALAKSMFANTTSGTGTVTVNHNPNAPASVAAFNALKLACTDDTGVIYGEIKDGTTEPTVDTTVAPTNPEVTPSTGDATVVLFAISAACLVAAAAMVFLKKRISE